MTDVHSSHTIYDELGTPAELHADCEAVRTNMPILGRVAPIPAHLGEAVRRTASRPVIAVSDAAARLGSRLNPFD